MGTVRRTALAGTILIAFVIGIFGAALLSEYQADAATVSPLTSMDDVVRSLRARGLTVSATGKLIVHPQLAVVGEELLVNGEAVVVYVFPSVTERAAADRLLRSQFRILSGSSVDEPSGPRIVAARNVLLLHDIDDDALAALIYRAAGDLAHIGAPT